MIGDEVGLTEELYQKMIGQYATAVEVLTRRVQVKDQRIMELETIVKTFEENHKPQKEVK